MNHPRYEILQDYFENALNLKDEERVKQHLLACDDCTQVISHFVVIETKLQKQPVLQVSAETKLRIMGSAGRLLKEQRLRLQQENERQEWLSNHLKEWKESIFPELRIPALQLASLALVLTVVVSVEKKQGTYEEIFEPISNDVTVFTAGE